MKQRVRLIYKLLSGFGIVVILVLGLFILANKTIEFASDIMRETVSTKIRQLAHINRLQSLAAQIRRLEAELSGLEDYFAVTGTIDELKKDVQALEQVLISFDSSGYQQADDKSSRLMRTWQLYRKELERALRAALNMKLLEARKISLYSSLPRFRIFAGLLEKYSSETEKSADEAYAHALSHLQVRKAFFLWTSIVGIGLVALFALIFSRSLSSRIMELSTAAERLSKGEFDYPVRINGKDEIADLTSAFNKMRIQIRSHQDHLEELVAERTTELAATKDQAEAANQAKSEFLARMSHEIRTPLNAVTGLTHIVLKSNLTAQQRNYLEKIQIASNNLLDVINDILDFSKVEAGRLKLSRTPFDLDRVIEELADLFSNRLAQEDMELIFAVAPDVPRQLAGDPGRLTQVLTNLVENAVKFTDEGEIVVGVKLDNQADQHTGQTALQFRISDTGIGIAADVLPTLFEPFTQVEGYLSRKHEGSGLGLAICRRLVELMGGRIWAESTPGRGSTFAFTVLLELCKQEKLRFSLPPDLHGLKALVADDSASSRQVLCDLLESFALHVSTVDSGEQAIKALRRAAASEPYQLILLDWKMPGMDGIETARRIRALEFEVQSSKFKVQDEPCELSEPTKNQEPKTPIIILVTAYGHGQVQKRMDRSAADTLLLKPVKASQLFNTIMDLFGRAEAMVLRNRTSKTTQNARLAGRRVLLVEDSELNRDVALALLEETGLLVETAENGQIAVDKVTASPRDFYDAVLMDIQMPIMDGYEATARIREWEFKVQSSKFKGNETVDLQPSAFNLLPGPRRLPIIALTAHALKVEKEKCLAAGMDDHIAKPISEQDLHKVLLKRILPRQQEVEAENPLLSEGRPDARAVLDVQGALKRMGGRRSLYIKLLNKFEPEFGQTAEMIRRLLAAGDLKTAELTAHSVKGVAATIGATALFEVAAKLEKAIGSQAPDLEQPLASFGIELVGIFESIRVFLHQEQTRPH
jgi:two-component system sensor histidine kinase/response regulator